MAFNIPTEEEIRAIDTANFIWDDIADGTLTMEQAAVLKAFADQMTADQTILLKEPNAGTGKTAKFIIDNADNDANVPKIVVQDTFVNTFLYCDDFWETVEDDLRVYQNPQIPNTVEYNEAGEVVSTTITYPNGATTKVDLTQDPETVSDVYYGNFTTDASYLPERIVNVNGDAIGSEDDDFVVDLTAIFPFPISLGFELHERKGLLSSMCSSFNRLPVGGVMLVFDIAYARVNEPLWDLYRIMDAAGKGHETEWLLSAFPNAEQKGGPWKCAAIRRTY
jgi:hypothetical protein